MKNPEQKLRYTNEELGLMKALFADNDAALYIIRKAMMQFPMTDVEKTTLKASITPKVFELLKKTFLPEPDAEAPLFQMSHLCLGLGADIKSLSPDGAWPYIKAKQLEIEYLTQQVNSLIGEDIEPSLVLTDLVRLDYVKKDRELAYINLTAWNFLLSFIDSNIQQLKFLAGLKDESVEDTIERLRKNSTK